VATVIALAGASARMAPGSPPYTESGGVAVDRRPVCGAASGSEFPIETRLRGGPGTYRPGGGAGTWSLELTNTTDEDCRHIHPVVVLVDRFRTLDVSRVTLEVADAKGRLRALALEKTDEDEIIGVLDDGSAGFSVPAGRTVTVRARLAFATGTRPNEISVTAATVQRRGDDGDWVGESNVYRFTVHEPGAAAGGGGARDRAEGGGSYRHRAVNS
jgi:hypothetical protein